MCWATKKIKYMFVAALVCCMGGNTFSQLMEEGEVSLYASYGFGTLGNKSFNKFARSYSEVNAASLEKPLSGFKTASGFTFGIRSYYGSINYMRFEGTARAVFKNGDKRLVKNTITTPINVGLPMIFGKVFIHPKFGFAETRLDVTYEYANGIESIGNETRYSGQYHTFGFYFGLDLAFSQAIGKHHRIEAGISSFLILAKGNEYSDLTHARGLNIGYYPTSLPMDVAGYGSNGIGYLDSGKGFVNGQNTSLSAYITYSYIIFKND